MVKACLRPFHLLAVLRGVWLTFVEGEEFSDGRAGWRGLIASFLYSLDHSRGRESRQLVAVNQRL